MLTRSLTAFAFSALILTGCQDKEIVTDVNINPEVDRSQTAKPDADDLEVVDVKATTHLFPDEKIITATIAPKSGMRSFSSQILLLSESGKIYSTTTAFPQLELVSEGPYSDILGFYLDDNRSGFLAVRDQTLKAYMDGGETGFEAKDITAPEQDIGFCKDALKTPNAISFRLNTPVTFQIEATNDTVKLDDMEPSKSDYECGKGLTFLMSPASEQQSLLEEKTQSDIAEQIGKSESVAITMISDGLILDLNEARKKIRIIGGLSIDGIANPAWVFSTSQPLGNTFNQGVTLVRGDDTNRIVMIANDYLGRTVFGEAIETDQ